MFSRSSDAVAAAVRKDERARRSDPVIQKQHRAARTQARRDAYQTTQKLNQR